MWQIISGRHSALTKRETTPPSSIPIHSTHCAQMRDFIIICVSDNAIGDVAARIPADTGAVVAHTSGTTGIEVFRERPDTDTVCCILCRHSPKGFRSATTRFRSLWRDATAKRKRDFAGLGRMFSTNVNHADSKTGARCM